MADNQSAEATTNNASNESGEIAEEILDGIIFTRESVASDPATNETIEDDRTSSETVAIETPTDALAEPQRGNRLFSFLCHLVMGKTWAEYFISLGLLLTILTALFHSQCAMKSRLTQRKAPQPVRFFPSNSPVSDMYDGNGFDLHTLLASETDRPGSNGILFVMYYAPWCARSVDARWHLDNLARYFYPNLDQFDNSSSSRAKAALRGPVNFVAVNCWNPKGQCRQAYRLYAYPVFLVYPATTNGIYYNGIIAADYMFRFLENVIAPLVRLQTYEEVLEFLYDLKTSVVAYFDFKSPPQSAAYNKFYAVSLKALERDPLRAAAKFGILTDADVASRLNFTGSKQIKLFRHMNETILDFPNGEYTAKSISEWVYENLANPVRWVSPSTTVAGKSEAFHQLMTRRPTLLLFAPRLPLFDLNQYYSAMTVVALRYFDCFNASLLSESVNEIMERLRNRENESRSERERLSNYCLRTLRDETRLLNDCCHDISHLITNTNNLVDSSPSGICHTCIAGDERSSSKARGRKSRRRRKGQEVSGSSELRTVHSFDPPPSCECFLNSHDFPTSPLALKRFFISVFNNRYCDRVINEVLPKSSVIDYCCRQSQDGAGAERWIKRVRKERQHSEFEIQPNAGGAHSAEANCEKLRLSRLLGYAFDKEGDIKNTANGASDWTGLSCRTNRTLQFAAMDRNVYGAFAKKLGVEKSASPVAVIIDSSKEAVYLLDGPLDANRLGSFVVNFTYSRLQRFYRSAIPETGNKNVSSNQGRPPSLSGSSGMLILAVTSATFQSVIMDRSRDVLLLYTARWCAGCQRIFHIYQTLAYYFRVVNDDITFAQIDVTVNDLPWEFTVDSIPSLILFPADRKSDSVAFPAFAPWTLPNLVAFVVSHCQQETRLKFALSTCIQNSTGDGAAADSPCLVRNRYRTWRRLARTQRRSRFVRMEVERAIEFSKFDWDHDDDDQQWRVYLRRSWDELSTLETKRRTLSYLLTNALRRSHYDSLRDGSA